MSYPWIVKDYSSSSSSSSREREAEGVLVLLAFVWFPSDKTLLFIAEPDIQYCTDSDNITNGRYTVIGKKIEDIKHFDKTHMVKFPPTC